MAKKIDFKRVSQIRNTENIIPREVEEKIDAWISSTNEHVDKDQHGAKADVVEKKPIDIVRLNINIPKNIHHTLKKMCVDKDITITDHLINLINKDLNI